MLFAKKQVFFISLILSLCLFFAPFTQELYAEGLLSKIKTKASEFIDNTVKKYTSRDFWVDTAAKTLTEKVIAKPVKLATAALGIAVGTAVGGPVGATLGAYVGNKIGTHLCSIVGTPIVKGIINEKLDNGENFGISSIFNICKNLDGPKLACDTTGAVVGDILGCAIGGVLGAAITACVGGGTILPIVGTITFATLGAKYGKKFGTWLGKKIGEKFFNKSYKALTGIDRTEDQSASKNILLSTAEDIASLDKEKLVRTTTSEVVGDVIGSVVGTVAGATLSAFTTGGTSETMVNLGEKWGSKLGKAVGKWLGTKFFDKSKEAITTAKANSATLSISKTNTVDTNQSSNSNNSSIVVETNSSSKYTRSDASAAYQAYLIAYENYSKALADKNSTLEYKQQMKKEYDACFDMYKTVNQEVYGK